MGLAFLDATLPTPEENLALDEALLEACDAGRGPETLRVWESPVHFVVLGRSDRLREAVDVDACRRDGLPVLRRTSGGGAVLLGPGCLSYALVLETARAPLADVPSTNGAILGRHAAALAAALGRPVEPAGVTDLALGDRKFSGNSQRRSRRAVLFHGTVLLRLDLARVARYLRPPSRQPEYRAQRTHEAFLINLGEPAAAVVAALRAAWGVAAPAGEPGRALLERVRELAATRYSDREWNERY